MTRNNTTNNINSMRPSNKKALRLNQKHVCFMMLIFISILFAMTAIAHWRIVTKITGQQAPAVPAVAADEESEATKIIPTMQSPNGGAFVHMGKTGGSTLSVLLKNGCHSYVPHPCRNISSSDESIASELVESYYHVPDFGLLQQSKHDFYIITTRDPFDRVVSSFTYEHYLNRVARKEKMASTLR